MKNVTIIQPDDWHCHLRDNEYLARTVADIARQFARAIVMPNLQPPITHIQEARDYQKRIEKHIPAGASFKPLMTLYLTDSMDPSVITDAKQSGVITACKYYPAGATTHSDAGVSHVEKIYDLLAEMQKMDLPLCIHGESIGEGDDIFERENIFLNGSLKAIIKNFPKLRIILEHISTRAAVEFVQSASEKIAATITPHHLYFNRNDLFHHGIRPHYFCMPILKHADDQRALIAAAISGNSKFFLGTDSAPHTKEKKEASCGCAGIYSAHAAIELYTEIFDKQDALDKLENFASVFGAEFYQLPINTHKITLIQQPHVIPNTLSFGASEVIPMKAGETVSWRIHSTHEK